MKDRRIEESTRIIKIKTREFAGKFQCHDCRKYIKTGEMAQRGTTDVGVSGYSRCIPCHEARESRIKAHTRRIHREMALRRREPVVREKDLTDDIFRSE